MYNKTFLYHVMVFNTTDTTELSTLSRCGGLRASVTPRDSPMGVYLLPVGCRVMNYLNIFYELCSFGGDYVFSECPLVINVTV